MKKLIYLFIAVCLTFSCKTDDVNDVRNPLPTILVVKTVKFRQNNILSTYTFDYDSERRISKITRESTNDVTMEFTYNADSQIVNMLVSGEGGLNGGVGIYEYQYDEETGRLNRYLYGINYVNEPITYNVAQDQYNMTTPNWAFRFFENMDLERANARYFDYDRTMKGPLTNVNGHYHFISLLGPDPNLYYILTKRPIAIAGPASDPDQLIFDNTYHDDFVIKSLDENYGVSVEYIYTLTF